MKTSSTHRTSRQPFRALGYGKISHRDIGHYHCWSCGSEWEAKNRTWWPVRLLWSKRLQFGKHGWETGANRPGEIYFATCWSVGPLRVVLGDKRRELIPEIDLAKVAAIKEAEQITS